MGQIVATRDSAYVTAAEALLTDAKIAVLVQVYGSDYLLTVPDLKHELAIKILKRADLDPAKVNIGDGVSSD